MPLYLYLMPSCLPQNEMNRALFSETAPTISNINSLGAILAFDHTSNDMTRNLAELIMSQSIWRSLKKLSFVECRKLKVWFARYPDGVTDEAKLTEGVRMNLLKIQLVLAVAMIGVWATGAQASSDWRYHAFGKSKIELIKTEESYRTFQSDTCAPTNGVQGYQVGRGGIWDTLPIPGSPTPIPPWNPYGYGTIVDTIVNVGKTIWSVVEANRPVVNIQSSYATALPRGSEDWTTLECWSRPTSKLFKVTYSNYLKSKPVSFEFKVLYNYGGRKDGVGRYLNNVTIVPTNLSVGWGYKFSAETVVGNVLNAGPASAPVAALELQLNWSVETVLKHIRESETFYVRGDGYFERIAKDGK